MAEDPVKKSVPEPRPVTAAIDELEHAITTARGMPMSSSVIINRAEILGLIDEIRESMPEELAAAGKVLSTVATVRTTAEAEAATVIKRAEARAKEIVSREAVVAQSLRQADHIVKKAEKEATRLTREADDYCDRKLGGFEIELDKLVAQVKRGREALASRLDDEQGYNTGPFAEFPGAR